ncbi:MAG: hypothetical protein WBG80_16445 [Bacteroidota bacterium]
MTREETVLRMNSVATYRIEVQGRLDVEWADRLEGMNITHREHGTPVTTLIGRLRDQAALSGLLNSLYELRLPLLSVVLLEYSDDDDGKATGNQ